ncbi:hypothetical protein FQN52_004772 [Onygenales sp. PD_12]|nr:hypothetical protein FQN52_004772 [Onygenales sp. PD_12]
MSAPQSPQSPPQAHHQSTPWSQVSLITDTPSPSPPSTQLPISTKPTSIHSQVKNSEQFNLTAFLSQEGLFLLSRSPTPNIDNNDIDEYDKEAGLFCEDDYLTDPKPKSKPKSKPKPEPEPQPKQEEAVEEFILPPLDSHTDTHKELIDTLN